MRCFLSLSLRVLYQHLLLVFPKTALIKILYRNATIVSPVLQKKAMHQEMLYFWMEPQLRGQKVREFIYLLFINDAIGSPII
jgi:hypothetical protein